MLLSPRPSSHLVSIPELDTFAIASQLFITDIGHRVCSPHTFFTACAPFAAAVGPELGDRGAIVDYPKYMNRCCCCILRANSLYLALTPERFNTSSEVSAFKLQHSLPPII